jgi:Tfp pilus assembly protein PilO
MRDFLNKITPQQKMILVISLCIGLSIGVSLVFYFYLYQPKMEEVARLKEELEKKELENMQYLSTYLAGAERTRDQKTKELRTLEKGLPEEEYVPTLLTEIESLGENIRARISSIALTEPTQVQTQQQPNQPPSINYKEMTLSIPFQGSYEVLKEFLNRLGNFPMVVVVSSMQISRSGEKDPYDGTPILSATLPAIVYILPKGGEKSEKTKI